MPDEQVDQEELRELEQDLRNLEELRERQLHSVISTAFQEAADKIATSLREQKEGELPMQDAVYTACRETGDRIVFPLWFLVGVTVLGVLVGAGTTYYTVNHALDLATERARVLVVGEKDRHGVHHPGLAASIAQELAAATKVQRESLVRELEGMQESHEQALKELLQPVRPAAPTRAPQNRPSASASDSAPPAPTPPTRPATERNWSTIGR